MIKQKRFLGNPHSLEVHDEQRERTNCQLEEIKHERRRWYDSLLAAKADKPYDNCHWCLGSSNR